MDIWIYLGMAWQGMSLFVDVCDLNDVYSTTRCIVWWSQATCSCFQGELSSGDQRDQSLAACDRRSSSIFDHQGDHCLVVGTCSTARMDAGSTHVINWTSDKWSWAQDRDAYCGGPEGLNTDESAVAMTLNRWWQFKRRWKENLCLRLRRRICRYTAYPYIHIHTPFAYRIT